MVGMKSEVGYQFYMQEQHPLDRWLVEAVPGIALSLKYYMPFAQFLEYSTVLEKTKHVYRLILIVKKLSDQIVS